MATSRGSERRAFTLLEIIIVLAVAAVLIGLCIPFISGMLREEQMREPVRKLQDLAKVMRSRAMTERVPYEISFNAAGFLGRKLVHYTDDTSDDTGNSNATPAGTPPKTTGTAAASPSPSTSGTAGDNDTPPQNEVIGEYALSPEMTCQIMYWGNSQWVDPAANGDPEQCRWVFQPSGLCNPIRVQFHKGNAWIEVTFNPLTADTQDERYLFPE